MAELEKYINWTFSEKCDIPRDINAEVELWTRAGNIKIGLGADIDIRKFDDLIASILL